MIAVIRLADARFRASTMISCSITHWLIGAQWLWMTNASVPRTDSSKRTKISPLAKSYADCGVMPTPRCLATSWASSGCARPARNIRFFFGVPDLAAMVITPRRPHRWRCHSRWQRPRARVGPPRRRSEERRVGKECRSRWWADHEKQGEYEVE